MTVKDEVSIKGLRRTHFEQLKEYIVWGERSGTFYGNRKLFLKRQNELFYWVNGVIDYLEDK